MSVRKQSSVSPPVQVQNQFGQPHGHQPYPFFGGQVRGQEDGLQVQQIVQHPHVHAAQLQQQQQQYGSGFSGTPDLKSQAQLQHQQHVHAQASGVPGMQSQVIYPQQQAQQRPPTSGYITQTRQIPQQNMRGSQRMSVSPSQSTTYIQPQMAHHMYQQQVLTQGFGPGAQVLIQPSAPPMQVPQYANPRMTQPYGYPNMVHQQQYSYPGQGATQGQSVYYNHNQPVLQQPRTMTPNPPAGAQQPYQKRERKMLSIIDPNTGQNVTDELTASQKQATPPVSGSNSARATPQGTTPPPQQPAPVNEVAAKFAEMVASVALDKPKAGVGSGDQLQQQNTPSSHLPPQFVPGATQHIGSGQAANSSSNNTETAAVAQPDAEHPVIDSSSASSQSVAPAHMAPHTHHSHQMHEHSRSSADPPQHDVRASSEPPMAISTSSEPALTSAPETAPAAQQPAPQPAVAAVTVSITAPTPEAVKSKKQEEKPRPTPPKEAAKEPTPPPKQPTPPARATPERSHKTSETKETVPAAPVTTATVPVPAAAAAASVKDTKEPESNKASSKNKKKQKMRNLKEKGDNQGTDMDAFTDESATAAATIEKVAAASPQPEVNGLAASPEPMAPAAQATPAPAPAAPAAAPAGPVPAPATTPAVKAWGPKQVAPPPAAPAPAPVKAWGPKQVAPVPASTPAPTTAAPKPTPAQEPTPVPTKAPAATPVTMETKCDSSAAAAPEPAKPQSKDSTPEPVVNSQRDASKDRKDLSTDKVLDHRQSVGKEIKPSTPEVSSNNKSASPVRTKEPSPEVEVTPPAKPEVTPPAKPEVTPPAKPEVTPPAKPEVTPPAKPEVTPDPKVTALNEKNTDDSKSTEKVDDDPEADESVIDEEESSPRLKLQYKEDQWSPLNPEGKKSYDRSFLLQLQYTNDSVYKPTGLPDLPDCILDQPIMPQGQGGNNREGGSGFVTPRAPGLVPDFTPRYMKSQSQDRRGGPASMGGRSRSSQKDGRDGGPRGSHDGRGNHDGRGSRSGPKVINLTIGLNAADVKLNKTENAWKPGVKDDKEAGADDKEAGADDEKKTAEVFKKVRSILNKLTPQKFDTLLKQIRELDITTTERLKGAIDLIFEKAIDEPGFAVAYGRLCNELCSMKVDKGDNKEMSFRWVLLQRCQTEFSKDKKNDEEHEKRKQELEAAPEADKKKLEAELKLAIAKAKRRSVGNIRFIGELFKLNMLTIKIIFECVNKLMIEDEDSLECLCRLFTTIGKDFDAKALAADKATKDNKKVAQTRVDGYYISMAKLADHKKTSSRIRFMIQDVLDLRKSGWVARRDDGNPKTIAEIHKEAQLEDQQKAAMAADYAERMKHGGGGSGGRDGRSGGGRGPPPRTMPQGFGTPNQSDEGWQMASGKSRNLNAFEADRMKLTPRTQNVEPDNIVLGPGAKSWGMGARGGVRAGAAGSMSLSKSSSNEGQRGPVNRFAALGGRDDSSYDNREGRSMSGQAINKNRLLTPSRGKQTMGRQSQEQDRDAAISAARSMFQGGGSRGGSKNSSPMGSRGGSRESSLNRMRQEHQPGASHSREGSRDRKRDSTPTAAPPAAELSREIIEKKSKALLDEFLSINDLKEAIECVQELKSPGMLWAMVDTQATEVIEKKPEMRRKTGELHHEFLRAKILTMEAYIKGIAQLLEFAEDMAIDIPKFYVYVGELIGPLVQESGAVPLKALKDILAPLRAFDKAGVGAAEVLKEAVGRLGAENIEQQWLASELTWTDFLPEGANVEQFVKDHKLEFTVVSSGLSAERVRIELDRLICTESRETEVIIKWVEDHVGAERAAEPAFIRALMTSVCTSALIEKKTKVDIAKIQDRGLLFQKFLDHNTDRELQALYALQALVHKIEHPSGMLKTYFDCLYDEDIISEDSFNHWNSSSEPTEMGGSGMAKTSVQNFFKWLQEAEDVEEA